MSQPGLSFLAFPVMDSHGKRLPGADKNSQLFGPGQAGINEVTKEHPIVLAEHGQDNHIKLGALGLMNRYGKGMIQLGDLILAIFNHSVVGQKTNA